MSNPLLLGLPGTHLTQEDREHLEKIQPCGVILFARNFESVSQIKELIAATKSLLGPKTMVAVDHEGGRVVRFPKALPPLPAPRLLGEKGKPEEVHKVAKQAAEALCDWGFTMNFAPVVDTLLPQSHKRMIDRCFGSDIHLVAEMGVAFIEGMQQGGIQCCAKHFPCIGPAKEDTHDEGSVVSLTLKELDNLWFPFKQAIKAGVDAVMVTHATYLSLDQDNPATLSKKIITDILRHELNFKRTIVSDDLEMGAIVNSFGIEEATKRCLEAGCDIACICKETDLQRRAFKALKRNNE